MDEQAASAMLVTTADFLPDARKFEKEHHLDGMGMPSRSPRCELRPIACENEFSPHWLGDPRELRQEQYSSEARKPFKIRQAGESCPRRRD